MRILSISTDRSVCDKNSATSARQAEYGKHFSHLDIIVLSLSSSGCKPYDLPNNVQVYPTNSKTRLHYFWDAIYIAHTLGRHDVISVQDPFETGLIGFFVARRMSVPLHVQVHTDVASMHFLMNSVMNMIRRLFAFFVLKHACRIRVVSERIKSGLDQLYKPTCPISVLPIYTDMSQKVKSRRMGEDGRINMLFVGRLEKEKRPMVALEALRAVRDAGYDAGLTFVGDGRLLKKLEAKIADLHIQKHVHFVGRVADPSEYYQEADVLLSPSAYEGYGMAIVEALSAGLPVISTDVGIAREAGAIIASHDEFGMAKTCCSGRVSGFSQTVIGWLQNGPHYAELLYHPYKSFDEYAQQYAEDVAACAEAR